MSYNEFLSLLPQVLFIYVAMTITVPGFVKAVRTLPWVQTKVAEGTKPWSCNICMCFWSCVLFMLPATYAFGVLPVLLAIGPTYTTALRLNLLLENGHDAGVS